MRQGTLPAATRVAAGAGVGLVPDALRQTPLGAALAAHGRVASDPARNFAVEIEDGLLICARCRRWYPIVGQLPELLPDHLRDPKRDRELFATLASALPADVRAQLAPVAPAPNAAHHDAGAHYKTAEMSIRTKIDDPGFFGPGYSSPFNLWNPEFTLYLVSLFGAAVRQLELRKGETILDSGCGYAWTTEWLHRAGLPVVGVDITRTYLEIGIERMGSSRPHLVVGDVEQLPFQSAMFDAILAYESFHHIPDRRRAMSGYDRVLREVGRVVLAEPGGAHEDAAVAQETMTRFGILERGMELPDVSGYTAGTALRSVEQMFLLRTTARDRGRVLTRSFMKSHSIVEGNLFRLMKDRPGDETRIGRFARRCIRAVRRRVGLTP